MDFLHHKLRYDTAISTDGFIFSGPVMERFTLSQTVLCNGTRAIDILADVPRVLARFKAWIPGTHSPVSQKYLTQCVADFSSRFKTRFQ
jgi:hypothetical protein